MGKGKLEGEVAGALDNVRKIEEEIAAARTVSVAWST